MISILQAQWLQFKGLSQNRVINVFANTISDEKGYNCPRGRERLGRLWQPLDCEALGEHHEEFYLTNKICWRRCGVLVN